MSDWPTMYESVPICDECGLPIPVCDKIAPFRREVRVLKRKLAAAEARIEELEAALRNPHKCAECGSEETYITERRGAPGRDKAPQALEPAGEAPYIPGPEAEELP